MTSGASRLATSINRVATTFWRSLGRLLGLLPIQRVVKELTRRGVDLRHRRGLDLYGGSGERTTRHYARLLASLDVWEIDPSCEAALRRNLPGARIKICDSYEEIRRAEGRYGFVVLDSPTSNHGGHTEHFDMFPHVFRVMDDDCVLILHVISEADSRTRRNYPYLFNQAQLDRRRSFYESAHPEKLSPEQLAAHYRRLLERNGFAPEWHFVVPRWELRHFIPLPINMFYLVVKVGRTRRLAADGGRPSR